MAPNLLAPHSRRRIAYFLLFRGVGQHGGDAHAETNLIHPTGRHVIGFFLVVDDLRDGREALAAIFPWHGNAGKTCGGFSGLPRPCRGQGLILVPARTQIAVATALGLGIRAEEAAGPGAERSFFRGVGEVHVIAPYAALRRSSARIKRSFHRRWLPNTSAN